MTLLFRWPEAAAVGRVIPKERLYAEAGVTKAVRQRFIDEIQRVRWAYKLSEESLRLRGRDEVAEVQVFEIELKGSDVSESVLTSIDKSVPSPIIFELHRSSAARAEVQLAAARKEPGPRGPKLSGYFKGDWVPADVKRSALPPSIDLAGLYAQVLMALMPVQSRPGEELLGVIDRMGRIRKLERAIAGMDRELRTEPQFNRKVQLRRELRARQAELDTLMNENEPTTEDATWRS
ncbi:MAG: hypothetical protein JWP14_1567 [Frankiales bacterium]|nr:hypothetical protein [Frankiales bacterium]